MNNTKIYKIKSDAAPNHRSLLSANGKYFYWNSAKFATNQPGHAIFVINRYAREALFTIISEMGITTTWNE